jgi:hypothetical protein
MKPIRPAALTGVAGSCRIGVSVRLGIGQSVVGQKVCTPEFETPRRIRIRLVDRYWTPFNPHRDSFK